MASGDVRYRVQEVTALTAAQAAQFATLAKTLSGWSGAIGQMRALTVDRNGAAFRLIVEGIKLAPLASVPKNDDGTLYPIEGVEP